MNKGVCMKEQFEVVTTRVPIGEQVGARADYEARYARWKAEIQEIEKAGAGCKADRSGFGAPPVP